MSIDHINNFTAYFHTVTIIILWTVYSEDESIIKLIFAGDYTTLVYGVVVVVVLGTKKYMYVTSYTQL